jgi:hypothetical protein
MLSTGFGFKTDPGIFGPRVIEIEIAYNNAIKLDRVLHTGRL